MNLYMPASVCTRLQYSKYTDVNECISVNLCMCVCFSPYSQLCMCSFMVFQTFVFLIYFTSKGHMESWGPSSIWAVIEGETDKR